MLLNDVSAMEKAQKMVDEKWENAKACDPFWVYENDEGESPKDIYAFYVKGEDVFGFPGYEVPLFHRDGTPSVLTIGIPA